MRLFAFHEQNIQTKEQKLNCDFTILLNSNSFLFLVWYGDVLESALSFWSAFWQIPFIWLSKVSLLSILIPKVTSSLFFPFSVFFSNAHIVTFVWIKYHQVFMRPFYYCPEAVYQNGFYKLENFTCIVQTIIVSVVT